MTIPTIAIIRDTALLSDALVESYVRSQQIQISRDFSGPWAQDAKCIFVPGGQMTPPGSWEIWLKDHIDQVGALGFHTDDGNPRSFIGIGDALEAGASWTVTASHEALEMLADPTINRTFTVNGFVYACEVADACEDDQFAYFVAGHHLTDFMLPAWFDPGAPGPYTFRDSIDRALGIGLGGYIGREPIGGAWEQWMGDGPVTSRMVKGPTSRTMRRFKVQAS